ncbi:serine hydrolase [Bacillus sp. C1]
MSKTEIPVVHTLHTTIENMMKDLQVPGAAVAVIKDGEVIVSEGFGYRNLEQKEPVTPQTRFAIGSTTKAFGTLSLSLLAQQKKFDWDAPVQSYIPTFSLSDVFASSQITARDLASHRSGVSRHDALWYNSSFTRKDIIEKIKHLSLDAPFRTTFLYNNLMYATISYIVESITNQTWEEYVTEHILEPLQMEQTNFSVTDSQNTQNYALPYVEKNGEIKEVPFRNLDSVGAAGCINSTIEDMANWVLLHLNQGKIEDHELVSSELLEQMYTPHNTIPDQPILSSPESPVNSYGLGWFISTYRGYKVIHHSGGIDGFSAFVSFIPKENIGIVILTNAEGTLLPSYLANQIYDELLTLETIDWHKRAIVDTAKLKEMIDSFKQSLPEPVKETAPSHPLKDFTGTFEHPAYGTLEVYKQNEELYVQFLELEVQLQHHHYDMFSAPFEEMKVLLAYEMDTKGQFETIQLHVPAIMSTQPLTFTKLN